MAMTKMQQFKSGEAKWQDVVNLVLAAWLFVSPWLLNFAVTNGAGAAAAWNAWIVAIVIAVFAIAALNRPRPWEEWVNILAGAWLFVSPWVLGYAANGVALWNSLIIGAVVLVLSIWDLNTQPAVAQRQI